eukprot:2437831-Alexandrium_andersonii.AAC.1
MGWPCASRAERAHAADFCLSNKSAEGMDPNSARIARQRRRRSAGRRRWSKRACRCRSSSTRGLGA